MVLKLQFTLLRFQEEGMNRFTKEELGRFCQNMEVLFIVQDAPHRNHHSIPTHIPSNAEHKTTPHMRPKAPPSPTLSSSSSSIPPPSNNISYNGTIKDTMFYTPLNDPNVEEFLARAMTSHLQTHGSTVVTGSNPALVNMYV